MARTGKDSFSTALAGHRPSSKTGSTSVTGIRARRASGETRFKGLATAALGVAAFARLTRLRGALVVVFALLAAAVLAFAVASVFAAEEAALVRTGVFRELAAADLEVLAF